MLQKYIFFLTCANKNTEFPKLHFRNSSKIRSGGSISWGRFLAMPKKTSSLWSFGLSKTFVFFCHNAQSKSKAISGKVIVPSVGDLLRPSFDSPSAFLRSSFDQGAYSGESRARDGAFVVVLSYLYPSVILLYSSFTTPLVFLLGPFMADLTSDSVWSGRI